MKKKVRVLRRKSSSYEDDEDELPISKRRKSCDARKKRGRKPKRKVTKKAETQERPQKPEEVIVKTEPLEFKSETEFNNIVGQFPDLQQNDNPVTSFAGILDKNARNENPLQF